MLQCSRLNNLYWVIFFRAFNLCFTIKVCGRPADCLCNLRAGSRCLDCSTEPRISSILNVLFPPRIKEINFCSKIVGNLRANWLGCLQPFWRQKLSPMNRDEQLLNIKKHRENQVRSSYNDQKGKKIYNANGSKIYNTKLSYEDSRTKSSILQNNNC